MLDAIRMSRLGRWLNDYFWRICDNVERLRSRSESDGRVNAAKTIKRRSDDCLQR